MSKLIIEVDLDGSMDLAANLKKVALPFIVEGINQIPGHVRVSGCLEDRRAKTFEGGVKVMLLSEARQGDVGAKADEATTIVQIMVTNQAMITPYEASTTIGSARVEEIIEVLQTVER